MIKFQERNRWRRVLYSNLTLLVLGAILVFFAKSTYGLWERGGDTRRTLSSEREELAALLAKDESLRERIAALKTDRGVEEAIREKFKVAKEGEGVVVVIDPKDGEDIMASEENPIVLFLKQWFGF